MFLIDLKFKSNPGTPRRKFFEDVFKNIENKFPKTLPSIPSKFKKIDKDQVRYQNLFELHKNEYEKKYKELKDIYEKWDDKDKERLKKICQEDFEISLPF